MSKLEDQVERILATVEELREAAGDGLATRRLLDSLFRKVHDLKATASANGLDNLANTAHELENVLQSLRTGLTVDEDLIPQISGGLTQTEKHALRGALKEGAGLFLVQTNFDVADFDRQFQSLKEHLSQSGEVISTAPTIDNAGLDGINFRILYARAGALPPELSQLPNVRIEHVATNSVANVANQTIQDELKSKAAELEQLCKSLPAELLTAQIGSVENLLDHAVLAGQAVAMATGKQVQFVVRGRNVTLNKSLCAAVSAPLVHLVRNAVDHGIEDSDERSKLGKDPRGTVTIETAIIHEEARITVTDDGRGIDPEKVSLIFQPGFSTASGVSEISGRGVGLDAVETRVKELGGSIRVETQPGKGSSFEIRLTV